MRNEAFQNLSFFFVPFQLWQIFLCDRAVQQQQDKIYKSESLKILKILKPNHPMQCNRLFGENLLTHF